MTIRTICIQLSILILVALSACAPSRRAADEVPPPEWVNVQSVFDSLYTRDPAHYWSAYGIPPAARAMRYFDDMPRREQRPFDRLREAFLEERFLSALESGNLLNELATIVGKHREAGLATWPALVAGMKSVVEDMDSARMKFGEETPRVGEVRMMLRQVFDVAFDKENLLQLRPRKGSYIHASTLLPQLQLNDCGEQEGEEETDAELGAEDTDNSRRVRFDSTEIRRGWNTTYNASCGGQAYLPCAAKLGIPEVNPDGVTCMDWNKLSKRLGATQGEPGTSFDRAEFFFEGHGYCGDIAWEGPFESIVEQAKVALDRGCDVLISYHGEGDEPGHIEMVTDIQIDLDNSSKALLTTLSWGSVETVQFEGESVNSPTGKFKNKSDAPGYDLPREGGAALFMICKCEE